MDNRNPDMVETKPYDLITIDQIERPICGFIGIDEATIDRLVGVDEARYDNMRSRTDDIVAYMIDCGCRSFLIPFKNGASFYLGESALEIKYRSAPQISLYGVLQENDDGKDIKSWFGHMITSLNGCFYIDADADAIENLYLQVCTHVVAYETADTKCFQHHNPMITPYISAFDVNTLMASPPQMN